MTNYGKKVMLTGVRRRTMATVCWLTCVGWMTATGCQAQTFSLTQQHDSLFTLTLRTDSTCDKWTLPYPVYRMDTGDVNGDGSTDALVGVIKSTRFYPEKGRRLFIFKNYHGLIRPLWLGSKLGGELCDFRFADGRVRSMEAIAEGRYVVAEYRWSGFGLVFERFVAENICCAEAQELLNKK